VHEDEHAAGAGAVEPVEKLGKRLVGEVAREGRLGGRRLARLGRVDGGLRRFAAGELENGCQEFGAQRRLAQEVLGSELERPAVELRRALAPRDHHERHLGRGAIHGADLLDEIEPVARREEHLQQQQTGLLVPDPTQCLVGIRRVDEPVAHAAQLRVEPRRKLLRIVDVEDRLGQGSLRLPEPLSAVFPIAFARGKIPWGCRGSRSAADS
jgi:hypothetical protein